MSSLFKAGKRLVDEFKPMLVAPDRGHAQDQLQNPYGSPHQPYAPNFTPTTNLSSHFQQPGIQTGPYSSPYGQSPQYQLPTQQSQTPGGGYFAPQPQSQPQLQPQPNHQSQAAQSSQYLPVSQQVSPYQTSLYQQQYQLPASQQSLSLPQTQQKLTENQYLQPLLQQQQQPQYTNYYTHSNPPPSPAIPSAAPTQQQYGNHYPYSNPSPSPAVPTSSHPSYSWSPPAESASQWHSTAVTATSEASTTATMSSAVELPAADPPIRPTTQPNHANPQNRRDGAHTPVPYTQPNSAPPQVYQKQNGATGQPYQNPPPQQVSMEPSPPVSFATATPPMPVAEPQLQTTTHNHVSPQTQIATYTPQPATVSQYFSPPPTAPVPPVSQDQPQQHLQPASAALSPLPQPQPYPTSQQQFFPNQPQQNYQYLQMVPQQQQAIQGNLQYHSVVSPPPTLTPFQSTPQESQIMSLQQGVQALSITSGLSASFKEVMTKPRSAPTPSQKAQKDGSAPSVLRVQTDGNAPKVHKILCLDGGGVRGLASLMILKHLMQRLESQRGGRLEPWQEFDMIAGTSTGGLIAIMLGRLRMSIDECIETYKTLSRKIFTPVHSKANIAGRAITKLKAEGKFESEPLEQVVKEICRNRGLAETELLKDSSADAPKVFVCAAQGINSDAVVIRSYESGSGEWDDLYEICKIWEAARATSAASTFFDPIQIGHQKYVDGALRYNNPIEKADQESRDLWPNAERLIVSIGTGSAPGPNVLASNIAELGKTLVKIVTDSEEENARFRRRNKDMVENNLLFRFNVLQGLADVQLNEWDAIGDIMAHTGTYLRYPDTARNFTTCANMMKESGQRLGYIAGEELRVYQEVQEMSTVYCEFCEDCNKGIPYLEKMFLCVDCQLFICEDCHDSHERTHLRTMLRFNIIKWIEKLPGIAPSAPCRYCAKESKVRWQCHTCDLALCRNCVGDHSRRVEFFSEHRKLDPDGRYFFATYPPYWSTTPSWIVANCRCLDLGNAISTHCERCHRVVTTGQRLYFCRLCRTEFGSSQLICQECFEEDEEHREKHQFGTAEIAYEDTDADDVDDALKKMWGCSQCPERFAESKRHLHTHLHLKLIFTPFIAEILRIFTYRSCYRKVLQETSIQYPNPTPFPCALCTKKLAFDQIGSLCLRKGCSACYCSSCTTSQRAQHRHPLYEFTLMKSPKVYVNQIACSHCAQAYVLSMAEGLWCADCKNHFICFTCMQNVWKSGTPKVEQGLPHVKYLKQCKVKNGWQFYLMEERGQG